MNKYVAIILWTLLTLTGCITIEKAIVDEITLPNGSNGFSVDCGMYGWSGCYVESGKRCTNGYIIHERTMPEDIQSKIPVEEMKDVQGIVAVPIRAQHDAGKYMIISCK